MTLNTNSFQNKFKATSNAKNLFHTCAYLKAPVKKDTESSQLNEIFQDHTFPNQLRLLKVQNNIFHRLIFNSNVRETNAHKPLSEQKRLHKWSSDLVFDSQYNSLNGQVDEEDSDARKIAALREVALRKKLLNKSNDENLTIVQKGMKDGFNRAFSLYEDCSREM